MKTKYLGLRTTVYYVSDLQKAKEWYTQAFNTTPYFDEVFYIGFNIGGYELGLLPEKEKATNKDQSVVAYWGVEDIQQSYNELIEAGADGYEEPENVGGDLMAAAVKDPWNNIIGIIYNPYFKTKK